jgi:hypothetical protein
MAPGRLQEPQRFVTTEATHSALVGHTQLDKLRDVSAEQLLVDGVLQRRAENPQDVTDGACRQHRIAAVGLRFAGRARWRAL